MKFLFYSLLFYSLKIHAQLLQEDPNFKFEVLFTNPECATYNYKEPIYSNSGNIITQKTQNAYCSRKDLITSGFRENAPQQRLVEWIEDENVVSINLAFLSFSDSRVLESLCKAIARGVNVQIIMDKVSSGDSLSDDKLSQCGGTIIPRGHTSGIDLAHMKMIIFEMKDETKTQLVFGSANLSSGTTLHHENWNFLTASTESHFIQQHICAYNSMISANSGREFKDRLAECTNQISSVPEKDIQVYFIPDERNTTEDILIQNILDSQRIQIAAHRFSNTKMLQALSKKLSNGSVDIILDDDVYWVEKGFPVGPNSLSEAEDTRLLINQGAQVHFVETNHYERLLHHNKFIVFDDSVWTGAGNLTNSAFDGNYENFYLIHIPSIVDSYRKQYEYMWDKLSLPEDKMPTKLIKPKN